MIRLSIEDYCHNCPDFEADVDKSKLHLDMESVIHETNVRCEHRKRCKSMMRHLEKELKKESDNVS